MMSFTEQFKAARIAGVPLVKVDTPDPASTMRTIESIFNGNKPPIIVWDMASGLRNYNEEGEAVVRDITARLKLANPAMLTGPVDMLKAVRGTPEKTVIFFFHHRAFFDQPSYVQATWNLRDELKEEKRMLVLLSSGGKLPEALEQDFIVIEEQFPDKKQLKEIILGSYENLRAKVPNLADPSEKVLDSASNRLSGMSAFTAEQVSAMCLKPEGIDMDNLIDRQCQEIGKVRGCSMWRGGELEIAGCKNYIDFMDNYLTGPARPGALVVVDSSGMRWPETLAITQAFLRTCMATCSPSWKTTRSPAT